MFSNAVDQGIEFRPFGRIVERFWRDQWTLELGPQPVPLGHFAQMCRLLVLKAAWMMDEVGAKNAKSEIAQIKTAAPKMALQVIDDAIQAHGGGGVCQDYGLASSYAGQRTLRLADGPDEVHRVTIAKEELKRYN